MQVTVLTLHYAPGTGFDAEALESFSREHEVLEVKDQFFMHEGEPRWAVLLCYRERAGVQRPPQAPPRSADPRKGLDAAEQQVYDLLRDWRSLRANSDGVPPYLVFTNRQLADIARSRPESKAALERIGGVGRAKVERYFEEIARILAENAGAAAAVEEG